jgi:coenzyme F420-0:L-glutamate ligase / coenzyme F420-1:gamma-L-glutamate ligase
MIADGTDAQARDIYQAFKTMIESRRSYKMPFSSEEVAPAMIDACLDVARWAPSAHNEQPWRFIIFYSHDDSQQALRITMLDAMEERYKAALIASEQGTAARARQTSNAPLREAPVLILAMLDVSVMDVYPDGERQAAERIMGVQSVAACLQTLLLAFHVAGLRACWRCAPLFAETTIQDVLHLPASLIPQAFVTVGHGDAKPRIEASRKDGRMPGSRRKPVSEIVLSPFTFLHPGGEESE